jgi:hypothetical protein
MHSVLKSAALTAALLITSLPARATVACAADTLESYLAEATPCSVGGLLFSGFTYSATSPGLASADIVVTPVFDSAWGFGLTFSGGFLVTAATSAGSTAIYNIGYWITPLAEDPVGFTTQVSGGAVNGRGSYSVAGKLYDSSGTALLARNQLTSAGTGGGQGASQQSLALQSMTMSLTDSGQPTFLVTNQIVLSATKGAGNSASFDTFSDDFSVPEPGTLALLALGVGWLMIRGRMATAPVSAPATSRPRSAPRRA